MSEPREKQLEVLDFIERAIQAGYRDIVIAASTGTGKTALGVALCEWAKQEALSIPGNPGGYYLVIQKILQDQITKDFETGKFKGVGVSIKSSVEYDCPYFKNCGLGSRIQKRRCPCKAENQCSYAMQKSMFLGSSTGITNYPYLFAEHKYAGNLPARRVLVLDECSHVDSQLLKFNDLKLNQKLIDDWGLELKIPELKTLSEFYGWISQVYEPVASEQAGIIMELANTDSDDKFAKQAVEMDQHVCKVHRALELIKKNPDNWVYWSEEDRNKQVDYIARPLDAAPYRPELVDAMGSIRLYMSAYPGPKEIFCRTLGLSLKDTAWKNVSSTFPPENRPIVLAFVGSMSKKNSDTTMPSFLKIVGGIMESHKNQKGLIHTCSYRIGEEIYNAYAGSEHGKRLLFPRNADEREPMFKRHFESKDPTIIISPSMTEGFDFAGNLAEWQIIGKIPWPSLSDKQVLAKKEKDPMWYRLETAKTIIQASGRPVRSATDKAVTYILDQDFLLLWDTNRDLFPGWYQKAVVWT
jgi:ATP-dependent DNA helicase DinG